MAKITVSRPEPATPPPPTYTLELSEEEAKALNALLNGFGDAGNIRLDNPAQYDVGLALSKVRAS